VEKLNEKLYGGIIVLAIAILTSSIILSYTAIKITNQIQANTVNNNKKLLTINEASKHINLSEEEILKIIYEEEKQLITSHIITRPRFPYLKINDKYYIPKDLLDEWIKDANGRSY
jgi:hypothetical protein